MNQQKIEIKNMLSQNILQHNANFHEIKKFTTGNIDVNISQLADKLYLFKMAQ